MRAAQLLRRDGAPRHGYRRRFDAAGPRSSQVQSESSTSSPTTTPTQQQQAEGASQNTGSNSQEPGKLEVTYRGCTVRAARGRILRSVLLDAGLSPHNGRAQLINCRGLGTCGTCAVEVRGHVSPESWNTVERVRLQLPPHAPPSNTRLRLACQVSCEGPLEVVKYDKFWGQGNQPMLEQTDKESWAPFGPLEYVFDRTQRTPSAKPPAAPET